MKTLGINHIALVARDMVETVKFYTQVLEMPLVKTVQLPTAGNISSSIAVADRRWRSLVEGCASRCTGIASVRQFPVDAMTASDR